LPVDLTLTPTRLVEELNLHNLFLWISMIMAVGFIGYMPSRKLFRDPAPKIISSILIGQIIFALSPALCSLLGMKFSFASSALLSLTLGILFSALVKKSIKSSKSQKRADNSLKVANRVYKFSLALQLLVFALTALWVAIRGVHHYDYTYYHNLLSRSLAYSGTIYDNYLLEVRYGFWYPNTYGMTVVMDAIELLWAGTNSQIWWFINALVLPLLFIIEANRRFGMLSCVASLPFTIFITYQTLIDPRPHYIFAGILSLSFIYFMNEDRYGTKLSVARHLSPDDFLFLFYIASLLFIKREGIVYLIFIPIWILLRIGRTNLGKSLLYSSLVVFPIFFLRFTANSSAGIQVGSGGHENTSSEILLDTFSLSLNYSVQNLGGINLALLGFFLVILSLSRIKISRRQALKVLLLGGLSVSIFLAFIAVTVKAGTVNDGTSARKVPYLIAASTALMCFTFSNVHPLRNIKSRSVKNQVDFEQRVSIDRPLTCHPVALYAAISLAMVSHDSLEIAQNFRPDKVFSLDGEENYLWMKRYSEYVPSLLSSTLSGESEEVYFYPVDEQTDFNTNTFRGNQVTPQGFLAATHPSPIRMISDGQDLRSIDSLILTEVVGSSCPPIRLLQDENQFKFYYLTNSGYQVMSRKPISFSDSIKVVATSPEYEVSIKDLSFELSGLTALNAYDSKLYYGTFVDGENQPQLKYSSIRIRNNDALSLSRLTLRLHPAQEYRDEFPAKIEIWSGKETKILRDEIPRSSYASLRNPIQPDLIHVLFDNVPAGDSDIEIRLFHDGKPSSYNGLINLWFFDLRVFARCE